MYTLITRLHYGDCKCFSFVVPVQHVINCYCLFVLSDEKINVKMRIWWLRNNNAFISRLNSILLTSRCSYSLSTVPLTIHTELSFISWPTAMVWRCITPMPRTNSAEHWTRWLRVRTLVAQTTSWSSMSACPIIICSSGRLIQRAVKRPSLLTAVARGVS